MVDQKEVKEVKEQEAPTWENLKPLDPEFTEPQGPTLDTSKEDPGMLESYGSFPVWMLKGIQALTPDFLISKSPPKKKFRI